MSAGRAIAFFAVAWIALVLLAAAQAVAPVHWSLRIPGPDVVLIVVLYLALAGRGGLPGVCAIALGLGWFADLFAGSPKGLHMIVYAVAGLAARGASSRLLVRGGPFVSAVAGLFALVAGALLVGVHASLAPSLGWSALRQVPLAALVTALFAPPAFRLLARLDRNFVRDARALGGGRAPGTLG